MGRGSGNHVTLERRQAASVLREQGLRHSWGFADLDERAQQLALDAYMQMNPAFSACFSVAPALGKALAAAGYDVWVRYGLFRLRDRTKCNHVWLLVNGQVFDPTSDQFTGDLRPAAYKDDDFVDERP